MKPNTIVACIVRHYLYVQPNLMLSSVLYGEPAQVIKPNIMSVSIQFVGRFITYGLSLLILLFLNQTEATAQDSEKKTHFLIEPYFMAPTMKGEIGVRQLPSTEVDADAGDIFGQLKFGAMAYIEVNYDDKWSVSTDFLFMHLESDAKPNALVTGGTNTAKQLAFEFAGLKRIAPWFEVGVGGRIIDMKVDADLNTISGNRSGSRRKTWGDPILIVRSQGAINENWLLQFRGDVGGFGLASDFTWQIQANVGYQFSKLVSATLGYRVLDVNYDKGDGDERFMYDISTSGPVLRVGFRWE